MSEISFASVADQLKDDAKYPGTTYNKESLPQSFINYRKQNDFIDFGDPENLDHDESELDTELTVENIAKYLNLPTDSPVAAVLLNHPDQTKLVMHLQFKARAGIHLQDPNKYPDTQFRFYSGSGNPFYTDPGEANPFVPDKVLCPGYTKFTDYPDLLKHAPEGIAEIYRALHIMELLETFNPADNTMFRDTDLMRAQIQKDPDSYYDTQKRSKFELIKSLQLAADAIALYTAELTGNTDPDNNLVSSGIFAVRPMLPNLLREYLVAKAPTIGSLNMLTTRCNEISEYVKTLPDPK